MIDTLAIDLGIEPLYEERLMKSAKKLGWKVITPDRIPFTEELLNVTPSDIENPNVWYHGDIATAKVVAKKTKWQVHANWSMLDLQNYGASFKWLMFNRYVFWTIEEFEKNPSWYFKAIGKEGLLFIKSASADKTVAGKLISQENFVQDWDLLTFYKPPKDTMLAIASPRSVLSEARFLIVNGKLITGSYYRVGNQSMYLEVPESSPAWAAAQIYLKFLEYNYYSPGPSWVMDLAEDKQGVWTIMELGATSCCGMYACDTDKFCEALNSLK